MQEQTGVPIAALDNQVKISYLFGDEFDVIIKKVISTNTSSGLNWL